MITTPRLRGGGWLRGHPSSEPHSARYYGVSIADTYRHAADYVDKTTRPDGSGRRIMTLGRSATYQRDDTFTCGPISLSAGIGRRMHPHRSFNPYSSGGMAFSQPPRSS
jgi:hypothetical protein